MTTPNLRPVRDALHSPSEGPIEGFDPAADRRGGDDDGPPVPTMPDDCPVIPVGTQDGIFYFLTALGELRGLACDKVANKHILGMFAPETRYLRETWPRKRAIPVKVDGKVLKDEKTGEPIVEWIVTGWDNELVPALLMDVGAYRGVWNAREKVRGRGAWVGDDGGLILHCGNHVLIGGRWRKPGMYDGMVYPTSPPIPKPAGAREASADDICPGLVGDLRAREIWIAERASPAHVLLELFKTWHWERSLIDPLLLLGWICAAMMGGALDYRPLAWITGDKATGKSELQKIIGWLFDGGILQSPDASEAAVRQVLGQQSLPVGIDEAEASEDNRKILALVKLARLAASSQGNILRGGQDHQGHEFQATSCFLFSSILVPPIPPQERSRMAMLELGEFPRGSRKPRLDKREVTAIGAWLRRRLADRWGEWPELLELYTDTLIEVGEQGGRAADQFGTLLASARTVLEDDPPEDEELAIWGRLLGLEELAETQDNVGESQLCLTHLVTSQVQLEGRGQMKLVSEWLLEATEPMPVGGDIDGRVRDGRRKANDALGRIGMMVGVGGKGKDGETGDRMPVPGRSYVAIASNHQGLGKLFEGVRWANGVWVQALGRIPGAVKGRNWRIGGSQTKCTLVPVDQVIERDSEDEQTREMAEA